MRALTNRFVALALSFSGVTAAFAGPDWQENLDAGSLLGGAQLTLGVGALRSISGTFSEGFGAPDYEDMYLIRIDNPAAFNIQVSTSSGDIGLFLFNVTLTTEGFGLVATVAGTGGLVASSNDGSLAGVNNPGIYALAVAVPGRVPGNALGNIFNFANSNEISGPDGPGGFLPHDRWLGTPGPVGEYGIDLEGSGFAEVPAPGVLALAGMGALAMGRRRRN